MDLKITEKDHMQGNPEAPVELVEYGDYQCPYCKEAYYIVKEIQKNLRSDLKFVFRNFPLSEMHPYALHAALAAEAAGAQDKFWDMHGMLYENQEYLDDNYLIEYAKDLELDMARFEKDFGKKEYYQKVKDDYASGIKAGVRGTPSFYVNGKKFEGNWMDASFLEYLKSFI